jgi:crossover junction endodeoxyribonuclease RuvC
LSDLSDLSDQTKKNTITMNTNTTIRVLGIDAALRTTGYGVVDCTRGAYKIVDCGIITTTKSQPMSECMRRLNGGIRELLETYAPDVVSIEGGFFHKNARTAMVLGMARGAILAAVAERRIPVYEYAPRRIKQAICGHGNAGKHQVALLVAQQLQICLDDINDDATDALAAALCHAQTATAQDGLFLPDPL